MLELEIIVVDDCSNDSSLGAVHRLIERVAGLLLLRWRHRSMSKSEGVNQIVRLDYGKDGLLARLTL